MPKRLDKAAYAVTGSVTVFLIAVALVAAALIHDNYKTALANSEAQALRFVSGAEAAVNRSLLGVDVLLASLDNLLGLATLQPDWVDGQIASRLMQGALRQNLLVRNVALVNAQGRTVASSDPAGADLVIALPPEFVAESLAQPVSTLTISGPTVNFNSSEPVLYFGRHISMADGSKLLAVAEVQVGLLTTILVQGVDINRLEATLERGNGQLLASVPALEPLSGKLLSPPLGGRSSDSALQLPTRLSGHPAIVVLRNMLYRDILITASIPMDTVLSEWKRESWQIAGVAAAFALMILAAGGFAIWYLRSLAAAQQSIVRGKETLDQALESMENGFLLLDAQHCVVSWNRRYLEIYPWQREVVAIGVAFETLLATTGRKLLGDAPAEEIQAWIANRMAMLSQKIHNHERLLPTGDVIEITERTTPDGGVVIVYQDVTRLRRAGAEIEQLAFYDPLTGLPNRRLLSDRLQQAITACARNGRRGALLFMDLDHFKTLNDTLGHDVGDLLLQQVAERVRACVREADTVARLGGDEFVVMLLNLSLEPVEAAQQVQRVGDTILHSLNQPYTLNGAHYRSSCSMGAALFGDDGHQTSAELLKQADIAMYQVKNAGRNALCFFDPLMLAAIQRRADLERDLRQALAEQQLTLHYQLQITDTGVPVGAEALVRWRHPERGMVSPLEFIGLAEETGLILPLGQWVMETACQQLRSWQDAPDKSSLQLSVNVSARQFRQNEFVAQVQDILERSGANPNLLKLELTESMVLDNVQDTIAKMKALKTMGVRFSMDDFGTGQSSLTYLTQLPLDQLKIDQSFIHNIGVHASDGVIVQTIIGMANTLGLEVIAEGVETADQRDFLAQHGCHLCQGYLFAKPLPVADFEALLLKHKNTV